MPEKVLRPKFSNFDFDQVDSKIKIKETVWSWKLSPRQNLTWDH